MHTEMALEVQCVNFSALSPNMFVTTVPFLCVARSKSSQRNTSDLHDICQ